MNDKYKIVDVELWCADQVGAFQLAPCDITGYIESNVFCENEKLMLRFSYNEHVSVGHTSNHEKIDAIRASIHNIVVRNAHYEKIDVSREWVMDVVERLHKERYIY